MSNPTSITIQQNADGSYDLPAITLVPYVAPAPPPSPASGTEPAVGAPIATQDEWGAMNPQGS